MSRPSARFGSSTEEERGIHVATWQLTKLPNPLARAGRNWRASPTQTREKRLNGAAWAPILMFARGRAGAKGDVWGGILVYGHPVTGHPRATHLVHTLVHGPRSARKSSIRSMIRQFALEAATQNIKKNSDGALRRPRDYAGLCLFTRTRNRTMEYGTFPLRSPTFARVSRTSEVASARAVRDTCGNVIKSAGHVFCFK